MRFSLPGAASTSAEAGAQSWNRFHADAYLCPGSGAAGGGPGYVLSATIQLGPLSWVRGFASFLQGSSSSQWKLCRCGPATWALPREQVACRGHAASSAELACCVPRRELAARAFSEPLNTAAPAWPAALSVRVTWTCGARACWAAPR